MTNDDLLSAWLSVIGRSDFTIPYKLRMSRRASHYLHWIRKNGVDGQQLTEELLARYYEHLKESHSYRTAKAYVRDMVRLDRLVNEIDPQLFPTRLKWSWSEKGGQGGALQPAIPRTTAVSVETLQRHFDEARSRAHHITHRVGRLGYYRRQAMAEMIYGSGLSSRDLVDVKSSDLENASVNLGYFALQGAEGLRLVPVTTPALEAVATWRQVAEGAGIDTSDWLFPSLKSPSQLLLKDITRSIRDFGNDTEVFEKDQLNASTLRWAFANHLISNGADIRIVAYAMNLKDLRTMNQFIAGSPDSGDGEMPVP